MTIILNWVCSIALVSPLMAILDVVIVLALEEVEQAGSVLKLRLYMEVES